MIAVAVGPTKPPPKPRNRPRQLFIHVDAALLEAVRAAARDDERGVPDYVRVTLRRDLRQRGYLPHDDSQP